MKYLNSTKKNLLIIFISHTLLSFTINILSIENLKKKEAINFNVIGEFYKKVKFNLVLPKPIKQYAVYTGIHNGFGFYSPNLPNSIKDVNFYSGNEKLKNIVSTSESKVKFYTLMVNFTDNLKNNESRKIVIESLARIYFNNNKDKQNIKVVIDLKKINSLNEFRKKGIRYSSNKIEAYNIEKK